MDEKVLSYLFNLNKEGKPLLNSWELGLEFKIDHLEMVGILNSLDAREYIKITNKTEKKFQVTEEGKKLYIN